MNFKKKEVTDLILHSRTSGICSIDVRLGKKLDVCVFAGSAEQYLSVFPG